MRTAHAVLSLPRLLKFCLQLCTAGFAAVSGWEAAGRVDGSTARASPERNAAPQTAPSYARVLSLGYTYARIIELHPLRRVLQDRSARNKESSRHEPVQNFVGPPIDRPTGLGLRGHNFAPRNPISVLQADS